ncbi:MAG TPA: glyoxalase superfamily protein [Hyphomicrobiales bacterium]|nr:glyoxalase superfamily protein [Hyphomicrobiales bacterium]
MTHGRRKVPTIDELKAQAKGLRRSLEREDKPISHSQALELIAHQYGYSDWNTIYAAAGNQPPTCPVSIGERVSGQYLGQPFDGEVIGVQMLGSQERYRVTLHFDIPVDVVTFDSFSAFRQRVSCIIDRRGMTAEKTSNGNPHLKLAL